MAEQSIPIRFEGKKPHHIEMREEQIQPSAHESHLPASQQYPSGTSGSQQQYSQGGTQQQYSQGGGEQQGYYQGGGSGQQQQQQQKLTSVSSTGEPLSAGFPAGGLGLQQPQQQQRGNIPISYGPPSALKEQHTFGIQPCVSTGQPCLDKVSGEVQITRGSKMFRGSKIPEVNLNTGHSMPVLGLSTYESPERVGRMVQEMLEAGYRHLDCAWIFGNQYQVGQALRQFLYREVSQKEQTRGTNLEELAQKRREKLFISSKLWCSFHRRVRDQCRDTLNQLQLRYLDLFIIQWPFALQGGGDNFPTDSNGLPVADPLASLCDTWHEMEGLVKDGLVRSIGISNFNLRQLKRILECGTIKPAVLQIELHPLLPQKELVDFCQLHNIQVVAVAPLGSPERPESQLRSFIQYPELMEHPKIVETATKLKLSVPQLLLSYPLQKNCAVITKSSNKDHMKKNLRCCLGEECCIPQRELYELDQLGCFHPHRYLWFASARNLKEYPF